MVWAEARGAARGAGSPCRLRVQAASKPMWGLGVSVCCPETWRAPSSLFGHRRAFSSIVEPCLKLPKLLQRRRALPQVAETLPAPPRLVSSGRNFSSAAVPCLKWPILFQRRQDLPLAGCLWASLVGLWRASARELALWSGSGEGTLGLRVRAGLGRSRCSPPRRGSWAPGGGGLGSRARGSAVGDRCGRGRGRPALEIHDKLREIGGPPTGA